MRTCSPNIFIEKLSSALPAAGDPPKRIFGKSSHKPCPVMLGLERKCRISSHKARAQDICSSIKSERGLVRGGERKEISGKVSIVMHYSFRFPTRSSASCAADVMPPSSAFLYHAAASLKSCATPSPFS